MTATLECAMLACFGLSWPINMMKSFKSKTAKGKSLFFEMLIVTGYIFGIIAKCLSHAANWVLLLYVVNLLFVSADLCLTFRNKMLDEHRVHSTPNYRALAEEALAKYEFVPAAETKQSAIHPNYRQIAEKALRKYEP